MPDCSNIDGCSINGWTIYTHVGADNADTQYWQGGVQVFHPPAWVVQYLGSGNIPPMENSAGKRSSWTTMQQKSGKKTESGGLSGSITSSQSSAPSHGVLASPRVSSSMTQPIPKPSVSPTAASSTVLAKSGVNSTHSDPTPMWAVGTMVLGVVIVGLILLTRMLWPRLVTTLGSRETATGSLTASPNTSPNTDPDLDISPSRVFYADRRAASLSAVVSGMKQWTCAFAPHLRMAGRISIGLALALLAGAYFLGGLVFWLGFGLLTAGVVLLMLTDGFQTGSKAMHVGTFILAPAAVVMGVVLLAVSV